MAENEGTYIKDFTRTTAIASPGFSFGKQGNVKNAYLLFDDVPSNSTGAYMFLENAALLGFGASTSTSGTYEIEIYEHDTVTFTLLDTMTITANKEGSKTLITPVALTTGKRLAVKISNLGLAKDPSVYMLIRGDLPI